MLVLVFGISVTFTSCGDDDETQENNATKPSIVGRWVAVINEEGSTYVMKFSEDGTGYGSEGQKEASHRKNERYQFNYTVLEKEIYFFGYNSMFDGLKLDYTLSDDGNNLTIYGVDKDDLSVLHLVKGTNL